MFGGSRNTDTTTHNNLYRYDPVTNTWAELPTGAIPMYFGIMIALADRLLLQGGRNATTLFNTLWEIT
ncbi:Kelch motif protein [compost metagenome]